MKSIFLSIFFMLTLSTLFSQIKINGTKEVILNEAPQEGTFIRKEIDVTRTTTESPNQNIVIQNKIENSTVTSEDGGVKVALSPSNPTNTQTNVPKQIVIDMKEAKTAQDNNKQVFTPNANSNISIDGASFTKTSSNPTKTVVPTEIQTTTTVVQSNPSVVNVTTVPKTSTNTQNSNNPNVVIVNTNPKSNITDEKPVIETNTKTVVVQEPVIETNTKTIVTQQANTETSKTVETQTLVPVANPSIETPTTNTKTVIQTNPSKEIKSNTVIIDKPAVKEEPIQTFTEIPTTNTPVVDSEKTNTEVSGNSSASFPEKSAKQWAVGFNVGVPFVTGDVRSKLGYGGSVTVQKALGHVVSLRFQGFYAQVFGQDWKLSTNDTQFKNYKSRVSDYSIQGVFTLNNINFYKREPRAIFNVIAGAGFSTNYTWTNILDENGNMYDYSSISAAIDRSDRKDIIKAINELQDGGYETSVVQNKLDAHIKNTDINPAIILGLGLGFKISKRIDLNLEHRVSWHNADNLDGFSANGNKDWLQYTSLGLSFKIGKKEDAMWWMNPVYAAYDDINDLKKKVNEGDLLTDQDQDGVADIFDKDLNTPEKVLVDSRGVASDLDKDGVPDYLDKEPFTPIGAKIDKEGRALDVDKDGIADIFDMENDTPLGAQVDAKGRQIFTSGSSNPYTNNPGGTTAFNNNTGTSYNGSNTGSGTNGYGNGASVSNYPPLSSSYSTTRGSELGFVLFADNSSTIDKYYYPELYKVLSVVKSNPEITVLITGHTDVRATDDYNMKLSEDRANAVYTMLTEIFKVPSSRLILRYEGEHNPLVPGLPESNSPKYEPGHQLNRRVTLSIN